MPEIMEGVWVSMLVLAVNILLPVLGLVSVSAVWWPCLILCLHLSAVPVPLWVLTHIVPMPPFPAFLAQLFL